MYGQPYTLLIFDWDGTLSDSSTAIVAALRKASVDSGHEPPPDDALRSIIGLSLDNAAQSLFGVTGARARAFSDAYRQHFHAAERPAIGLFDGVRQCLDELRDAGFMLTVATGKGRVGLDLELTRSGLAECFDLTRCADETQSKPHPQMVLELLTDADCAPRGALVIGDTDFDLQMAHAAGVDSVAVSCGNHPAERLAACATRAVLNDVRDLPGWLAGTAAVGI